MGDEGSIETVFVSMPSERAITVPDGLISTSMARFLVSFVSESARFAAYIVRPLSLAGLYIDMSVLSKI